MRASMRENVDRADITSIIVRKFGFLAFIRKSRTIFMTRWMNDSQHNVDNIAARSTSKGSQPQRSPSLKTPASCRFAFQFFRVRRFGVLSVIADARRAIAWSLRMG